MEEKIIETCFTCSKKNISFERNKKINYDDIYLKICFDCPYKSEFMILSGNENSELPLEVKNVRQIINWIKSNKIYFVEKTTRKINIFICFVHEKNNLSDKYMLIFNFIKFLNWSDKLKSVTNKLLEEISFDFLKSLSDKRRGI